MDTEKATDTATDKPGYQKARITLLLIILVGLMAAFVPSGGAGERTLPVVLVLAAVTGWFFWKGKYGTPAQRKWVDENF